jgi:ubiquinone/menaquinone biosynthesis C-methylase UbiE/predicted metal-dependent enzyme (double-stranded beta helix superfamily)
MNDLLDTASTLKKGDLSYEELGKWVYSQDFSKLNYQSHLPEIESATDYSRNILCLEPLELVLLRWPPGTESGVHFHEGFYGYVVILQGEAMDIQYRFANGKLDEQMMSCCHQGGVIDEPDGIIHKIVNSSETEELVSLHIYYPALESFEGMQLFDLEKKRWGKLSGDAKNASFEDLSVFDELKENAFESRTWKEAHQRSHRAVVFKPKPSQDDIASMIKAYYNEQAEVYDYFDFRDPTRKAYTTRINELIAGQLKERNLSGKLLAVACGTGRRVLEIARLSEREWDLHGVDLSEEMAIKCRDRGLQVSVGNWPHVDAPDETFDALIFLYSFGHLCSHEQRLEALKAIKRTLKPGAFCYIDFFNLEDKYEWGPAALKTYQSAHLDKMGFDPGDVFYRKADGKATAFLHYFTQQELEKLFEEADLKITSMKHVGYVHRSGELVGSDEGFILVEAQA